MCNRTQEKKRNTDKTSRCSHNHPLIVPIHNSQFTVLSLPFTICRILKNIIIPAQVPKQGIVYNEDITNSNAQPSTKNQAQSTKKPLVFRLMQ